ncbi:MAG: FAD-binding oxidoreductase [Woeseiaceae bacterium]
MTNDSQQARVAEIWERPFEPPEGIPESADIVIIGGGIIGVSTAWFLARQGVNVVLCEKGHIAGEQSGRNWGWVRVQGRDTREMPIAMDSMRIWRGLAEEIGEDVGYTETGCIFTAKNDRQLSDLTRWIGTAREYGLDTRIITGDELRKHIRGSAISWPGALYTASDGRAEPHKATPAIARAAVRKGATVLTSCAVRGLDVAAGRVAGVVTEHGTIKTSVVLCAAGAWTSVFCRLLDISVPQLKVRGTVVRTAPGDDVLQGNVFDDRIGIRRREDGGYTVAHGSILDHPITPSTFRFALKFLPALMQEIKILHLSVGRDFIDEWSTPKKWDLNSESLFEKTRVLNPEPNPRVVRGIRRNLDRVFPQLASSPIVESWAGMIDTSPDVVPIIGQHDETPGFHIATGFSGHGFGIGPGAGKAIADMLAGRDNSVDLSPFRLSRFFDGTPIRPQSIV